MSNDTSIVKPQEAVVKYYKPSELLGMFTSYLSQQDVNRQVIYLQGIYLKNPKHDTRWSSRYDILRDENTQTEITLQIPYKLCEDLKDGNLVTVGVVRYGCSPVYPGYPVLGYYWSASPRYIPESYLLHFSDKKRSCTGAVRFEAFPVRAVAED